MTFYDRHRCKTWYSEIQYIYITHLKFIKISYMYSTILLNVIWIFSKVDVCLIVCQSSPHLSFYEFFELLIIKFTISVFIKPLQYSVNLKQRMLAKNLMDWAYLASNPLICITCSELRFLEIFENSFLEINPSWFLSRALKASWALLVTSMSETTLSLFLSRFANISECRQ